MHVLMNEHQVAQYLGISPKTLQIWRLRGKGPEFCKIGRLVKYCQECVDSYIEGAKRRSTTETAEDRKNRQCFIYEN